MPGAPPMPAAWRLYFATGKIEDDVARAAGLGARVLFPAMTVGAFGSMGTCADPTGATFGLWQAGQHIGWQVANEPGSVAWFELHTPNARQARDFYMALLGATADAIEGLLTAADPTGIDVDVRLVENGRVHLGRDETVPNQCV